MYVIVLAHGGIKMDIDRIKTLIPIIVSITAVIISAITFYIGTLRPADLTFFSGETLQIYHHKDGELRIDIPVVFVNKGSKPGFVLSMGVVIKNPINEKTILAKWEGFKGVENNKWEFRYYDFPIVLSGKSEIVEMVNFGGGEKVKNWIPEPVTYDIYLVGWTQVDDWPDLKYEFKVKFSKESIKKIRSNLKGETIKGEWIRGSRYGGGSRYLSNQDFNQWLSDLLKPNEK